MVNEVTGFIHMPNPSYYPVIAALGLFLIALGMLFNSASITIGLFHLPVISGIGVIVILLGIFGWAFEPASDPEPAHVERGATVGH